MPSIMPVFTLTLMLMVMGGGMWLGMWGGHQVGELYVW